MGHLERIAEYLLTTDVRTTVVFFDSSVRRFSVTLAEKAANFNISSAETLSEKLALLKKYEDVISSKIMFPDGTSRFIFISNTSDIKELKAAILEEVLTNNCKLIVFENEKVREGEMSYNEKVGWNKFKQVLKRGMGVDIVLFEDMQV